MQTLIVDYGLGNLHSVAGALEKLGFSYTVSDDPTAIENADKLILPGVGAFADGMRNLSELGWIAPLSKAVIEEKKPILGICLGFQLFAKESCEFGNHKGLGWIEASVLKLSGQHRIPHIGWNDLFITKESKLLKDIPNDSLFYYVHSFHVKCDCAKIVCGECHYGERFTAAIERENIYGTQFHPEKSQFYGLEILKNFLKL